MREFDWDSAKRQPDAVFHNAVIHALRQEEKPVKGKGFRTVLLTALIIVALAATALAVAGRAGLLDFIEAWRREGASQAPAELTYALSQEEPLLRAAYDDLLVTVTEMAGEGTWYYFNTHIELKPGVPGRVLCVDLRDGEPPADGFDGPTYYVRSYMMHENAYSSSGDWRANEDGSISAASMVDILQAADVANMYCHVTYVKAQPGERPKESDAQTAFLPFTVAMAPPERAGVSKEPAVLGVSGMTLDRAYLKKTNETTLLFLYAQYAGGAPVDYKLPYGNHGAAVRVVDGDTGEALAERVFMEWRGENRFAGYRAIDLERWPQSIRVELLDGDTGKVYGAADVSLQDGRLQPQDIAAYSPMANHVWDYRDMYFAWSDLSLTSRRAYVASPGPKGAAVYADPNDSASLIGFYQEGLPVSTNITFGGWVSIHIGGGSSVPTHGYIQAENLRWEDSPARALPGLALADGLDRAEVRIAPESTASIAAEISKDDGLYWVGISSDGWVQVAREEGAALRVLGYVPGDAVSLPAD